MIYDMSFLHHEFSSYSNIQQKIDSETKKGKLIRIKRGLYTDDLKKDVYPLANLCVSPSYISFEYALSYYGLIPEKVSVFTSACFQKKVNKTFKTKNVTFSYQTIPDKVYPYGVTWLMAENGLHYSIATPEKALLDELYSVSPVRTLKDMEILLFEDLRIDDEELAKLDFSDCDEIANNYHSNTIHTFMAYWKRRRTEK